MATQTAGRYSVSFEIVASERFTRVIVILRILLAWIASYLPLWFVAVAGPAVTAALVASHNAAGFREKFLENYRQALRFSVGFLAWEMCVVEGFPVWGEERAVKMLATGTPEPTVGSALLRYFTVIPHAIVWCGFTFVAMLFALVAAVSIVIDESAPGVCKDVGAAWAAYTGRVAAYYFSMTDEYPPFSFNTAA